MSERFVVAAQVSTATLPPGPATAEWVLRAVERVTEVLPLDILIVGGRESPELYRALTAPGARYAGQVFLWYNLLSDYPGMAADEGVVTYRDRPAPGWGEAEGESFRFACPNNSTARRKTLRTLDRLLDKYAFHGVFLDKIRFPSPANGIEALLSCFCPACYEAAAARGLDLNVVRAILASPTAAGGAAEGAKLPPGAPWLEALLQTQPTLQRFVRFRADSITRMVAEAGAVAAEAGRRVALDLFTPALAPLVGQDYPALGSLAEWGKPMTYRITAAPAGLRLELPALVRGLAAHLGRRPAEALSWAREPAPELAQSDLATLGEVGAPAGLVVKELHQAVTSLAPAPIYMGLETVSFPGVCEANPASVLEMIAAGRQAGVAGLVMSWDLLDTPLENVRAVARTLEMSP